MSHEANVRAQRIRALRNKGYRRVGADEQGRIVVEVKEEHFAEPELYRRVWGPQWPAVVSDRWKPPIKTPKGTIETPDDEQFQFHSRAY